MIVPNTRGHIYSFMMVTAVNNTFLVPKLFNFANLESGGAKGEQSETWAGVAKSKVETNCHILQ